MCHLKLDMLLKETGYDSGNAAKRLNVFLTNSLEEHHKDSHLPFANWLSTEANEASRIKRDMPIMIAIGNPPYNNSSVNKGKWITKLITDYKKGLGEKKSNIEDDYIKFIRLAEYYISKNGYGILAMITNNSFVDAITRRTMRGHLLKTFDELYVLDLGGDVKRAEILGEGEYDHNVFDIQQGVSISIFLKNLAKEKKPTRGTLYYKRLKGDRKTKYNLLSSLSLKSAGFEKVETTEPNFYFFPRENSAVNHYEQFEPINKIFRSYSSGVQTKKDEIAVQFKKQDIEAVVKAFQTLDIDQIKTQYNVTDDGAWKASNAKKDILTGKYDILPIQYRVFDFRYTALTQKSGGFLGRPRFEIMRHMLDGSNVGMIINRQHVGEYFSFSFVSKFICNHGTFYLGNRGQDYLLPLYVWEKMGELDEKRSNLDPNFFTGVKKKIPKVTPESLFDYIYAVLHSPAYRKRYAEFLKSDFPRIPYPQDEKTFNALAKLGGEIRALHLMEAKVLEDFVTGYPIGGDHEVVKPRWEDTDKAAGLGRVHINPQQYFDRVPKTAWEFYIGGYQPAQKWLKDRQGRTLSMDDIRHWQRVIVALLETDRLMKEIDKIDFLPKSAA